MIEAHRSRSLFDWILIGLREERVVPGRPELIADCSSFSGRLQPMTKRTRVVYVQKFLWSESAIECITGKGGCTDIATCCMITN